MMAYRREIDGLRAVAVMPVILFHAGFALFSGGFVGVDIFFVISGYLITSIIAAQLAAGTFTLSGFYERRARRILPVLFLVLLSCLPFAWFWLLPGDMKAFSESVLSVSTFSSNFLFWRTTGYFDSETELKPLLHTWSLAVEEQYYMGFPLIMMLAWRLGRRALMSMLFLVAAISLAAGQWGTIHNPMAAFYLLPTRAWELLIGAIAALHIFGQAKRNEADRASPTLGRQAAAMLGLTLVLIAIFCFDQATPSPGLYTLVPAIGATLILLFATPLTWAGRALGHPWLVGLGLISYSAYLWHQAVFAFARYRSPLQPGGLALAALTAATLALAAMSWNYVERPWRDPRFMSRKRIGAWAIALTVILMTLGGVGSLSGGFLYRYKEADRALASLQNSDAGHYVERRFNERSMKPFDAHDGRPRVLIIGDSFAEDLVNALIEAGFNQRIQISTRYIHKHCGNLFIAQAEFDAHIHQSDLNQCREQGLFEDARLKLLMLESDEIWLASAWQPWQASLINVSLSNIEHDTHKPVTVFGTKHFGSVDVKALLAMPPPQRLAARGTVQSSIISTNSLIKAQIGSARFIDAQQLLCGTEAAHCRFFTQQADLISYDGWHLTPSGAKYYGKKLALHALLKPLPDDQGALMGTAPLESLPIKDHQSNRAPDDHQIKSQ
jgi:peptidoglycan/LPS O-acetylase OafA/YrhL